MGRSKKIHWQNRFDLKDIIQKHKDKSSCSNLEAEFLLSKINSFSISHFYIIWKILTPESIFVGFFLKEFMSNLTAYFKNDSLRLVKILENTKFNINCFLFTVDFESLYTNIPVLDAIEMMKKIVFLFQIVNPNAIIGECFKNSLMTFDKEYFQKKNWNNHGYQFSFNSS